MNNTKLMELVSKEIRNGKSKKEVYEELRSKHDESVLARIVSAFPDPTLKKKYGSLNRILFILLIALLILYLLAILLSINYSIFSLDLVIIIFPLVQAYFAYQIHNFKGWAYLVLGLIEISLLFLLLSNLLPKFVANEINTLEVGLWSMNFILILSITILSFYLKSKIFPNITLKGPRKDKQGKYIF